jgi:hypothetical protein
MAYGIHLTGHTDASLIDLTHDLDVAYWCRIFDINATELRDAVQHAGPRAVEVQRYLQSASAQRMASPQPARPGAESA